MAGIITLFALSRVPVALCSYSKIIRTRKLEGPFDFHQIFSVVPKHRPFFSWKCRVILLAPKSRDFVAACCHIGQDRKQVNAWR